VSTRTIVVLSTAYEGRFAGAPVEPVDGRSSD